MATHIKKTRGRQKVPMEKMTKDSNRLVTFSKRWAGLFKKASELCTLTGAQVGIVVFSPAQKLYSFGHPSVDNITDRFIYEDGTHINPLPYQSPYEIQQEESIITANMKITNLKDQLDIEKKRSDRLLVESKSKPEEVLKFLAPVECFTLEELKEMHATLTSLRDTVGSHQERMNEAYSNLNPNPNSMCLTIRNSPKMVVGQNYSPNLQNFGGPPQMTTARVPYDNPHIMMIPTPTLSMAMRPSLIGMQSHDGFNNPNMVQPFQETTASLSIQGQFDGYQTTPINMGMNSMPGTYQGFTSFLMGDGSETSQALPFNPQGRFRFGPGPN